MELVILNIICNGVMYRKKMHISMLKVQLLILTLKRDVSVCLDSQLKTIHCFVRTTVITAKFERGYTFQRNERVT